MEGKAKVTVHVDGKEDMVYEGNCVFLVVCDGKDAAVRTKSIVLTAANAITIGRAIAEMEEKISELKRKEPTIALQALEWKLQLGEKRCDELLEKCEKILAGGDDE